MRSSVWKRLRVRMSFGVGAACGSLRLGIRFSHNS
ncbi:MAG: hypothetical protein JWQ00_1986, partial [Noviherbaspirillum sp.]|nr:hypothetical protein [Noviherbaspirillum sp.]